MKSKKPKNRRCSMSEFRKPEVRAAVEFLAAKLGVPPDELHVTMAAVMLELVGDKILQTPSSKASSSQKKGANCAFASQLAQDTQRLDAFLHLAIVDLPAAMDKYLNEQALTVMWTVTQQNPVLRGRHIEDFVGARCSGESIVLALGLWALFESKQRSVLYQGCSLEQALGLSFYKSTCGGGAVEYCDQLLEHCLQQKRVLA